MLSSTYICSKSINGFHVTGWKFNFGGCFNFPSIIVCVAVKQFSASRKPNVNKCAGAVPSKIVTSFYVYHRQTPRTHTYTYTHLFLS